MPKDPPFTASFADPSQHSHRAPIAEDVDSDKGPDCGLQPSNAEFREQQAEEPMRKIKDQRVWRKFIRNFTPS